MAGVRVTGLNPDGSATLEDGRAMQLVMAAGGALGLVEDRDEDHITGLDQIQTRPMRPNEHFDLSGLDQT